MKPKILISNLVYGEPYTTIFLTLHLKSLLDNCNPAPFSRESLYIIYTDGGNIEAIRGHENFKRLGEYFKVVFAQIATELNYDGRYSNQTIQFRHSMKVAIEQSALFSHAAADIYYGHDFWGKTISSLEDRGVQAVFGHPIRTAYEAVNPIICNRTLSNDQLFEVGFRCLHPLWAFSIWESPMFSKIPYAMLWAGEDQLIVRSFSITCLLLRPSDVFLNAGGCSDMTVFPNCHSYHVHSDWHETPLIETGMLRSFYPPFGSGPSSITKVAEWARQAIARENYKNIQHTYVVKKSSSEIDYSIVRRSDWVCEALVKALEGDAS